MNVGQFVYLKSSTTYAEVYDVATIQGTALGFTAGYVGKITKLNVAGVGETQTYTQLSDKYGETRYFSNKDADKLDFTEVGPDGKTNTGSTSGTGSGISFEKIGAVLSGLFGIFSKTKTTTTPTDTTKDPTTTKEPVVKDPTPANNNSDTGIGAWIKKNVVVFGIGVFVILGGIIWAIVAAVKSDKKDKEMLAMRNGNMGNQSNAPNPNYS